MGVVKVIVNGTTKMDITPTTATASDVTSSKIFFNRNGEQTTGTGSGGGSDVPVEKPVKFYDYDGTVLHEYTIAEAKALTALPANPTHTGLTAEGWNWTLQELKDYATAYPQADINIGQTYITSDGATKLHITLQSGALHPYLMLKVNGSITVDWGDSSTPDIMTGSGRTIFQDHEYSSAGNYVISISVNSGTFSFSNTSSTYTGVFRVSDSTASEKGYDRTYAKILTKVFLGENVHIEQSAFAHSYSLVLCCIPKDEVPTSSYIFTQCHNLKHLTIHDLRSNMVASCVSLKSLSLSKTCNTTTFYSPSKTVNLRSLTIPDNVTSAQSFSDCYSITKLVLPDSLVNISSINSCYNLENIVTNNNAITFTNVSCFYYCYCLSNLSFQVIFTSNSGMTQVFYNCYKLSNINYSYTGSSTTTGSNTFGSCQSLSQVSLPSTITTIGGSCFSGCYSLKSFEIPSEVTTIESSAFNGCYSLKELIFNNKLISIGNSGFYSCYNLLSVSLPDTLTTLGSQVFYQCYSLTTLTIPANVTSIGNSCFSSCTAMQEYHFLRTTPPTIGTTPFASIPAGCKIYVPYSADHSILNAYKTATNWSTYASYMEEEPQS